MTSIKSTPPPSLRELVKTTIVKAIDSPKQPSEWELVELIEERCGLKARWFLTQMYARFWNDLADHASA